MQSWCELCARGGSVLSHATPVVAAVPAGCCWALGRIYFSFVHWADFVFKYSECQGFILNGEFNSC